MCVCEKTTQDQEKNYLKGLEEIVFRLHIEEYLLPTALAESLKVKIEFRELEDFHPSSREKLILD